MQRRLSHIDVFKGILIIMVVMGHIVYMVGKTTGVVLGASTYQWTQYIASVWIAPYYMAAFFLASGYCSGFKHPLKDQIIQDLKRLVIPAITIPLLMKLVTPPYNDFNLGMLDFIIQGQLPWFLMAMFFARLIYKLTRLIDGWNNLRTIFLISLSIGGCWLLSHKPSWEYLSVFHGLAFVAFIDLGHRFKQISIKWYYALLAVIVYCLMVYIYQYDMPTLCSTISFGARLWPLHFLAVIMGSLVVYQISKMIDHNAVLEYLGRNSLVIYLTHIEFIKCVSLLLSQQIARYNYVNIVALAVVLFMLIGGTCWGATWAWMLNRKHLMWMIGK